MAKSKQTQMSVGQDAATGKNKAKFDTVDGDGECQPPDKEEVEKLLKNGVSSLNNEKKTEQNRKTTQDINKMLKEMPLTEDVTCGFWIFKGQFFQRFANQTSYVVLYGIVGCIFSMTYAYFNGTITTIEKRFKIPSRNTGLISVGNDISQMLVSAVLSYYGGKGHRPRWIGFGLSTIVAFCVLMAAPHFLYGPGDDALLLTAEFGGIADENATLEAIEEQRSKILCRQRSHTGECVRGEGNFAPQVVLFAAQFISGIGGSLYYTLGVAYMDDNSKKSKTPALLSLSYFLRMLGPAIGYALASLCLRLYIAPHLHPVIKMNDPRWLGAWWMGWLAIGALISFASVFLTMFPKELPRAKARRLVEEERLKQRQLILLEKSAKINELNVNDKLIPTKVDENCTTLATENKASVQDMLKTFKRLTSNKTLMCNNFSSVFYLFGYMPYWIFTPKYIEIQYRQSASTSSMVTGTVALAFSAVGVLLSGFIISRYKPRARYMAAWNVIVGFLTVAGMLSYAFIGCPGNEQSVIVNIHDRDMDSTITCNSACHCDYVRYSPVCGENNMTYISACHAGCKREHITSSGLKFFYDCSCIPNANKTLANDFIDHILESHLASSSLMASSISDRQSFEKDLPLSFDGGRAISGACPVDCFPQFVTFLVVMCFLKFVGATGRASNFLVSVRCVPEKDKTAAMGFGMMMMSMMAFIPSPIFFGWVLDRLCLVWGKTCSNKGNCWLYDPQSLRYTLNLIASSIVVVGVLFDCGVWYYVKDLKIFDQESNDVEMEILQHEEELKLAEKKSEV